MIGGFDITDPRGRRKAKEDAAKQAAEEAAKQAAEEAAKAEAERKAKAEEERKAKAKEKRKVEEDVRVRKMTPEQQEERKRKLKNPQEEDVEFYLEGNNYEYSDEIKEVVNKKLVETIASEKFRLYWFSGDPRYDRDRGRLARLEEKFPGTTEELRTIQRNIAKVQVGQIDDKVEEVLHFDDDNHLRYKEFITYVVFYAYENTIGNLGKSIAKNVAKNVGNTANAAKEKANKLMGSMSSMLRNPVKGGKRKSKKQRKSKKGGKNKSKKNKSKKSKK